MGQCQCVEWAVRVCRVQCELSSWQCECSSGQVRVCRVVSASVSRVGIAVCPGAV